MNQAYKLIDENGKSYLVEGQAVANVAVNGTQLKDASNNVALTVSTAASNGVALGWNAGTKTVSLTASQATASAYGTVMVSDDYAGAGVADKDHTVLTIKGAAALAEAAGRAITLNNSDSITWAVSGTSYTPSVVMSYIQTQLALGTAAKANTGTAAGNVPVLDSTGKLAEGIMPAISILDTELCSDAAVTTMDQLVAWIKTKAAVLQKGDLVIVNNGVDAVSGNYYLGAAPASVTAADLTKLYAPDQKPVSITINGKSYTTANNVVTLGSYVTSVTRGAGGASGAVTVTTTPNTADGTVAVKVDANPATASAYGVVKTSTTPSASAGADVVLTASGAYAMQDGINTRLTAAESSINGIKGAHALNVKTFLSSDVSDTGEYTFAGNVFVLAVILSNGAYAYPGITYDPSNGGRTTLKFFDTAAQKTSSWMAVFNTPANQHTIVVSNFNL